MFYIADGFISRRGWCTLFLSVALLLNSIFAIASPFPTHVGDIQYSDLGSEHQAEIQSLRDRAKTLLFHNGEEIHQYALSRVAQFKPYKALSDFVPPEFLEHVKGTEAEGSVLELLYAAYEGDYLVNGSISDGTAEGILLVAMGAVEPEDTNLNASRTNPGATVWTRDRILNMMNQLTRSRAARFRLEKVLAKTRLDECFSLWKEYLADQRQPVKAIRVYRFSDHYPGDLDRLVLTYRSIGFNVDVSSVDAASMERDVQALKSAGDEVLERLVSEAPQDSEMARSQSTIRSALAAAKDKALTFIGMLKRSELIEYQPMPREPLNRWDRLKQFGRTWTREFRELSRNRTALDKVLEFTIASATAAFTTWAVDQSLHKQIAEGEVVNTWLPILFAGLDKLYFVYKQQPLSALHGQGISLDPHTNKFDKNPIYLLGSNFAHSWIYRYLMYLTTYAAFNTDGAWLLGPVLATTLFADAFWSSFRNVYSKGPIQYFLEKYREYCKKNHHPRRAIAAFGAFNAVWAVVAMGDIFKWKVGQAIASIPFVNGHASHIPTFVANLGIRELMVGMSVIGGGIELWRRRQSIADNLMALFNRVIGRAPPVCETFLVTKIAPVDQDKLPK